MPSHAVCAPVDHKATVKSEMTSMWEYRLITSISNIQVDLINDSLIKSSVHPFLGCPTSDFRSPCQYSLDPKYRYAWRSFRQWYRLEAHQSDCHCLRSSIADCLSSVISVSLPDETELSVLTTRSINSSS